LALGATFLGPAGCDSDRSLGRMIQQPRAEPYGQSAFYEDGAAMRQPPAGTVARGAAIGGSLLDEGRDQVGYASTVPMPVTLALLKHGRERFDIYCAACHGVLGDGRSQVGARMDLRPPPSLVGPAVRAFPPGRVYETIRQGYGLMPSYAGQLSVEERWGVVAYLRALTLAQDARLEELPASVRAEANRALR
jgi:mono/diheme cytochrome c family protein